MAGAWSLRQLFVKDAIQQQESREDLSSANLIVAGDFRIDTVERAATLRGQELRLTSEEFDVLVFLTNHPQRVVTPQTMLATNWSSEGLHHTEFLKALMSLNRKLKEVAADQQYLRTEPWVIYRFNSSPSLPS